MKKIFLLFSLILITVVSNAQLRPVDCPTRTDTLADRINDNDDYLEDLINSSATQSALEDTALAIRGDFPSGSGDLVAADSGTTYETPFAIAEDLGTKVDTSDTRLIIPSQLRDSVTFLTDSNTYNTNGYTTRYWVETNISGGNVSFTDTTTTIATKTDVANASGLPSGTQGNVLIYDTDWEVLPAGTQNQVLSMGATLPEWTNPSGGGAGSSIQTLYGIPGTTPNMPTDTLIHGAIDTTVAFVFVNGILRSDSANQFTQVDSSILFTPELNIGDTMLAMLFSNVIALTLKDTADVTPPSSWASVHYEAYYDEMTNKPPTLTAQYQDTLYYEIEQAGLYDSIKAGMLLAQYSNTADEALIDLIQPTTVLGISSGSPTFTSNRGLAHNGTTSYTDLMFNASSYPYLLDAISIGVYSRTATGIDSESITGASDGSNTTFFSPRYIADEYYVGIHSGAFASVSNTEGSGFFVITRNTSSNINIYRDGSLISGHAQTSVAIPNANFWIGGFNNNGVLGEPSTREVSLILFMGLLDATQTATLNTIVEKFMDNIGAGVQ